MLRRAATSGLVAVFLATMLCAVICPTAWAQESHHSCCPQSSESGQSQCVDTHFMGATRFHDAAAITLAHSAADVIRAMPLRVLAWVPVENGLAFSEDLLTKHHILRI